MSSEEKNGMKQNMSNTAYGPVFIHPQG